ncbi:hypothetical protein OAA60_04995 [Porticoccaceae bacterium]|nr:hypothetical protein [Porticoccaceae bacterium]
MQNDGRKDIYRKKRIRFRGYHQNVLVAAAYYNLRFYNREYDQALVTI